MPTAAPACRGVAGSRQLRLSGLRQGLRPKAFPAGGAIQVLYNREVLPLDELCGAATCPLEAFRATAVGQYLLSEAQYQKECSLEAAEVIHFKHTAPAGEHVRVTQEKQQQQPEKAVSIGASMGDD